MQELRFPQWLCWGFRSFGMILCVSHHFRLTQRLQNIKQQWHSLILQKTGIL